MEKKVREFLQWEKASRDCIDVKKIYVDVAGDLVAGILLSQIIYWHLPSRNKGSKLVVCKDGEMYLAKKRTDWWDECRITPKQFDRAIKILKAKGIVKTAIFKFNGEPTTHIKIEWEAFLNLLDKLKKSPEKGIEKEQEGESEDNQKGNSSLPKGEIGILPKGKNEINQRGNSSNIDYYIDHNRDYSINNSSMLGTIKHRSEPPPKQDYFSLVNEFFSSLKQQEWFKDLQEAFPDVATQEHFARARLWLLTNPRKRKKDLKRFLYNWLAKEQERVDRMKMRASQLSRSPAQPSSVEQAKARIRQVIESVSKRKTVNEEVQDELA